jgi:hypothetical protein
VTAAGTKIVRKISVIIWLAPSRHPAMTSILVAESNRNATSKMNPANMIGFRESMN